MKTATLLKYFSAWRSSAVAAFVVIAGMALPASQALAVGELTCVATSEVTYSPGLRLFTQETNITFDANYTGCVSLTGSTITSGSRSGSFIGPRSCLALPPSGSGPLEVNWSNGESSLVDATSQSTDVGGQTVHLITGPIISGAFAGKMFNEQIVQASLNLLYCLIAPGITSQTGTGVVEIL